VGFVVTLNGVRIYHAGDADAIPEMSDLKVDVALLPVSGTYVMTAEEAAEAVTRLKPKVAIPMHYGAIVGSEADAQRFKQLAKCDVRILTIG
jgi:L-ascorbate metabolism protein UlaG (beta-lactamase superfamily)